MTLTMYLLLALTTLGPIVAVMLAGRSPTATRGRTLAWAGLAGALPMVAFTVFVGFEHGGAAVALVPSLVAPGALWGGMVGFIALLLRGRSGRAQR
jgi:hypothetical protein